MTHIALPTVTPNKGLIKTPARRITAGDTLTGVLLAGALASLLFASFPEIAGGDLANRIVGFVNFAVFAIAGTYQITVTRPNIPKL